MWMWGKRWKKVTEQGRDEIKQGRIWVQSTESYWSPIPTLSNSCVNTTFSRHFEAEIICWTAIWSTVAAWSGVPTVLVRRKASVSTTSLWDSRRGVRNGQLHAVRRACWRPTAYTRICNKHFVSGRWFVGYNLCDVDGSFQYLATHQLNFLTTSCL